MSPDRSVTHVPGCAPESLPFGAGCYRTSRSVYEVFEYDHLFDLEFSALRFVRQGDSYRLLQQGAFSQPPRNSAVLSFGAQQTATVSLASPFPHPGAATGYPVLTVGIEGWAGLGTAVPSSQFGIDAWLDSPAPRWGSWCPSFGLGPTSAVRFHEIGSVSYVTWVDIEAIPNWLSTFQVQFDRSNGNVTIAWADMRFLGGMLVGYAAGGGDNDLGSIDLSVSRASGTFETTAYTTEPLRLTTTPPRIGSIVSFQTSEYPPTSTSGALLLSTYRYYRGALDLTSFGMPDCFLHIGADTLFPLQFVPSGVTAWDLYVPPFPILVGFQLFGQAVAIVPGANPAQVISSNGVALSFGY
jgi:hypothetical protein